MVIVLTLGLFMGIRMGTASHESEEAADPVLAFESALRGVEGRLRQLVPDLLGEGYLGSDTELEAERVGLGQDELAA